MKKQLEYVKAVNNNNVCKVKSFLQYQNINPETYTFSSIRHSSQHGFLDIVKLLLEDERVNPSKWKNASIKTAFQNEHFDIVYLLWKEESVQKTLNADDPNLYHYLQKNDIKNKIGGF